MTRAYALLAPWYVRERHCMSFDEARSRSYQPALQKYVTTDFVERLLADPRDSAAFEDADAWSYPVPTGVLLKDGEGRGRFATHRTVRTQLLKLYQPSHERFYAVVVELFCDEPGLPRPRSTERLEVGFVVRRLRTDIKGEPAKIREFARTLTRDLFEGEYSTKAGDELDADRARDVTHLLGLYRKDDPVRGRFEAAHPDLLAAVKVTYAVEGWSIARRRWQELTAFAPDEEEQELPMWRLPAPATDDTCDRARSRSLWFGLVPTFSSDLDTDGQPKLDDRSIYQLQCFARERPLPGREHCPRRIAWSTPSVPYRLAGFFDVDGSSNRRVRVKLPDFHALAARAGEQPAAGGVEFERPPGSQLVFDPLGGIPDPGTGRTDGGSAERCTYAIELLTIVAMFVFSLFLPIVVFAFQLWWLLALRFCWPRNAAASAAVTSFFANGGTLDQLVDNPANDVDQTHFDGLIGFPGAAAALRNVQDFDDYPAIANDAVTLAKPPETLGAPTPTPEEKPADPLCVRRSAP